MTAEGGVSQRYAAYALALELGWADVDAMLDSIPITQFNEWMAFFKLREEMRENDGKIKPRYGNGDQTEMSASLLHNMKSYQGARDRALGRRGK